MTIREEVKLRIERDTQLERIRKKIERGKASYTDTASYSIRAGKLTGEMLAQHLPEVPLDEREQLCVDLLHDRYIDINAAVDSAQKVMDEAKGLHLAPQRAPFNSERAQKIGSSIRDVSKDVETQKRRARAATETATKAMHDERMEAEANFRSGAGLKCYITRVSVGGCCKWCTKVAGRYEYGSEPEDIFRRHDNCDCTVTYENGRERQDVWSKKTWTVSEDAGAPEPVRFTQEQAAAAGAEPPKVFSVGEAKKLEAEKIAQYKKNLQAVNKEPIDKLKNNAIIESEEKNSELGKLKQRLRSDSRVQSEYYEVIKKRFSHGSKIAKKAFNKYVPDDSIIDSSFEGIAGYDPDSKKISMHFGADLINERGPGATWFHEHGHLIDAAAGTLSKNPEFINALKDDYNSFIDDYLHIHGVTIEEAYSNIASQMSDMRAHSAVSDLMSALSEDRIMGVARHPVGYWEDDSFISSEAFAHMFEAQFDTLRYGQIQKYFPSSLAIFEKMLKEAVI